MQSSLQFDKFFDRKNFKILISRKFEIFEIFTKISRLKLVGTPCSLHVPFGLRYVDIASRTGKGLDRNGQETTWQAVNELVCQLIIGRSRRCQERRSEKPNYEFTYNHLGSDEEWRLREDAASFYTCSSRRQEGRLVLFSLWPFVVSSGASDSERLFYVKYILIGLFKILSKNI